MYILTEEGQYLNVPNVKGQSLRDAMELLSVLQVSVRTVGEGYVVDQQVAEVQGKRQVTLVLEPLGKELVEEEVDPAALDEGEENDAEAADQDDSGSSSP
ncbi:PASTA domain protein [compost metagenome]